MKWNKMHLLILVISSICTLSTSCQEEEGIVVIPADCNDVATVEPITVRGECDQTLSFQNEVEISNTTSQRIITGNSIPNHVVGLFGQGAGSLNPNAISSINASYSVPVDPELSGSTTLLLSPNTGPQYEFGVLLNGVLLDPEAAEPWPHDGIFSASSKNWEWNLDAMAINLGLDCNNAHVQPTGKYHYHGAPRLYLEKINASSNKMSLIGYAADGFPIYYRYAYADPEDPNSNITELQSSYQLKTGNRPGDGESAPCGEYSGIYTNDYEFIAGLGDLDECNGRFGVTPEYPEGIYYYVITESFPFVSRCLKGTPSNDFRLR